MLQIVKYSQFGYTDDKLLSFLEQMWIFPLSYN